VTELAPLVDDLSIWLIAGLVAAWRETKRPGPSAIE
jgi:hypothetical protein